MKAPDYGNGMPNIIFIYQRRTNMNNEYGLTDDMRKEIKAKADIAWKAMMDAAKTVLRHYNYFGDDDGYGIDDYWMDLLITCGLTYEAAEQVCYAAGEIRKADKWESIVPYMDDDIREDVHNDLAPCTREEFLEEYLKRDPGLQDVLDSEFDGKL